MGFGLHSNQSVRADLCIKGCCAVCIAPEFNSVSHCVCVCVILVVSLFKIPPAVLLGSLGVGFGLHNTIVLGLSDVMQCYLRPIPFMEVQRFIAH